MQSRATPRAKCHALSHDGLSHDGLPHRIADFADKAHIDLVLLGRINSAVIMGLVGGGLVACAVGATLYDLAQLWPR